MKYWISAFKLLGSPSLTYKFLKSAGETVPRSQSEFGILLKNLMTVTKYEQYLLTGRYTIRDMQILADLMGRFYTGYPGECLSSEMRNIEQPLLWKCGRCGFEHYQSFDDMRKNNFQPICLDCFWKNHIDVYEHIPKRNPRHYYNWDLLDRYNEIFEEIFLPHFYKKEFFEASLGVLEPLFSVFKAIFESGVESKTIIDRFTRNAPTSDRIIRYTLLKAREALFVRVITRQEYNDLLGAISNYAPHIVASQNDAFISYYKRYEPSFEKWLTQVPLSLITSDPSTYNKYHPRFSKPDIIRTHRELLYLEWGGRDLASGKLFTDIVRKDRENKGLPPLSDNELYETALLLIDRHHYQILQMRSGRSPLFMKWDCRLQALVPLTDSSHAEIRKDAQKWERRFIEAKQAILRGELYIPSWWDVEDRIAYAQYLRKDAGWKPFSYY